MSSEPKTAAELDAEARALSAQRRRDNLAPALRENAGKRNWVKGMKSPNPGGRPKSLPQFRTKCRNAANKVRLEILRRIGMDTEGNIPMKDLVMALAELSDRGGFLKTAEEAQIDSVRAKLVLAVMALEGLKPEQREKLLAAVGGSDD